MTFDDVESARATYYAKRGKITKLIIIVDICIILIASLFIIPIIIARAQKSTPLSMTIVPIIGVTFGVVIFSLIIEFLILSLTTKKELSTYQKNYKAYFVSQGLQKIFSNISYNHNDGMPREVVATAMNTGDIYRSNDLTTGCYKNINFTQADVHIQEKHTDSDGDTTYVTLFYGRFLVFDFNRNFTSNLQIASKYFCHNTTHNLTKNGLKFSRIQTESSDFNRNFKIYAQNGVDALYILDPAFMEKIQKLYTNCKHEILLTFTDKKVYIAIDDKKDSFEPPMQKTPLNKTAETTKVENDIRVITNFIDSLNLDRYFKGGKA